AAEEIARQLRLRDLAGLIVIDFIDMDERRNNHTVERRLKDALKHDRARIHSSVLESSTEKCPICGGSGHVRSVSSVTLALLRAIEEMLIKGATHNLVVRTRAEVALYVLNHKRAHLRALEERFRIIITVSADPTVTGQQSYVIDRGEQVHTPEAARILAAQQPQLISPVEDIEEETEAEEQAEEPEVASPEAEIESQSEGEREGGRKRRRRRGRGGRGRGVGPREGAQPFTHNAVPEHAIAHEDHDAAVSLEEQGLGQPQPRPEGTSFGEGESHEGRRRRRRGRRGGRRNRQRNGNGETPFHPGEPGPEPQMQHAVEEDHTSSFDSAPAYSPPLPPIEDHPAPPATENFASAASGQEPSRRRSTIREPAPFAGEGVPATSSASSPPTP